MSRAALIAALLIASPLLAQEVQTTSYLPPAAPALIDTPEIHIGSATEPSAVTVPPIEEITSQPSEPYAGNAPPASTALLATRHFDFIVSPVAVFTSGSMEDTSISLGEYARQLRTQKQRTLLPSAPGAIAQPADSE
jgi:hypothetical protein